MNFGDVRNDLTGTLLTGGIEEFTSSLARTSVGAAMVLLPDDGDPTNGTELAHVELKHDGGNLLRVSHPNHPFKNGDMIAIGSPDVGFDGLFRTQPLWEGKSAGTR